MTAPRYRVTRGWSVTAPGGRQWTGAPSQRSAFQLAQSLAGIDVMLSDVVRPRLAVGRAATARRNYGFHRMHLVEAGR